MGQREQLNSGSIRTFMQADDAPFLLDIKGRMRAAIGTRKDFGSTR
jgi:predicted ABC-type exoprotein transport system permease subunit